MTIRRGRDGRDYLACDYMPCGARITGRPKRHGASVYCCSAHLALDQGLEITDPGKAYDRDT